MSTVDCMTLSTATPIPPSAPKSAPTSQPHFISEATLSVNITFTNAPRSRSYLFFPIHVPHESVSSSLQRSSLSLYRCKKRPFYSHKSVAHLSMCFITFLFTCPEHLPSPLTRQLKLPQFIAYARHRTELHPSVVPSTWADFTNGEQL